jgi:hypothetical protein
VQKSSSILEVIEATFDIAERLGKVAISSAVGWQFPDVMKVACVNWPRDILDAGKSVSGLKRD